MTRSRVGIAAALAWALFSPGCSAPTPKAADVRIPRLSFTLPAEWLQEQPSSTMRALQARIPGADGDGQFTVFYFGEGKGGGVAENIQRWIDQIEFQEKSSTHREEFSANGLTIYWVDFSGTVKADPMGGGSAERKPRSRLLGAVIEGPGGPWFLKALGPDATLAQHRDGFLRLLESAHPID